MMVSFSLVKKKKIVCAKIRHEYTITSYIAHALNSVLILSLGRSTPWEGRKMILGAMSEYILKSKCSELFRLEQ